jgi:hypothetical protein
MILRILKRKVIKFIELLLSFIRGSLAFNAFTHLLTFEEVTRPFIIEEVLWE